MRYKSHGTLKQTCPRMILEQLSIANIPPQGIHGLMPAHVRAATERPLFDVTVFKIQRNLFRFVV